MHSKDMRARGETEQRLYMISTWREVAHLYSDRERPASLRLGPLLKMNVTRVADLRSADSGSQALICKARHFE
jgi:hypothetical protein